MAPEGVDLHEFRDKVQAKLQGLNTSGRVRHIQLLCSAQPQESAASVEQFFNDHYRKCAEYKVRTNLHPRALVYFMSSQFFARCSNYLNAQLWGQEEWLRENSETKDYTVDFEKKKVIEDVTYAVPFYFIGCRASVDSPLEALKPARRVVNGNEALWYGVAHEVGDIGPDPVCKWLQQVLNIEVERR